MEDQEAEEAAQEDEEGAGRNLKKIVFNFVFLQYNTRGRRQKPEHF